MQDEDFLYVIVRCVHMVFLLAGVHKIVGHRGSRVDEEDFSFYIVLIGNKSCSIYSDKLGYLIDMAKYTM